MTMREVVEKLQSQGNSVTFYVRKDGGILVTSINNQKFTGAHGNTLARQMAGVTISQKRSSQLKAIKPVTKSGVSFRWKKKNKVLDDALEKKMKRVQRMWNYYGVQSKEGRITKKKVEWNLKNLGYEEAMRKLSEAEKYAKGYAYQKNVDYLNDYIKFYMEHNPSLSDKQKVLLEELMQKIQDARIKEEDVVGIYEILYELNKKQYTLEEVVSKVEMKIKGI